MCISYLFKVTLVCVKTNLRVMRQFPSSNCLLVWQYVHSCVFSIQTLSLSHRRSGFGLWSSHTQQTENENTRLNLRQKLVTSILTSYLDATLNYKWHDVIMCIHTFLILDEYLATKLEIVHATKCITLPLVLVITFCFNNDPSIQWSSAVKGCDSNFDIKCSNLKSRYKWNNYLALNNMY